MILHEYQSKKIFSKYKIPIPFGEICNNSNELKNAIKKIKSNIWALKCQIHAGGRGKAHGIKITNKKEDVIKFAEKWFGNNLITDQTNKFGKPVKKILIENADFKIYKELYLSILTDFDTGKIMVVCSKKGGINIENFALNSNLIKINLDPLIGPLDYQGRILGYKLGLKNFIQIKNFTDVFIKLAHLFIKLDLSLLEINPLIVTDKDKIICLDAKIKLDKNAIFRHKDIADIYDIEQEDKIEYLAKKIGLNYVTLQDGNIGCLVNGAGLAMSTMDMLNFYGGKPANFLDISGGIKKENIKKAFELIIHNNNIKSILVNIFGGIIKCDLIAEGIINSKINNIPIIVRFQGNNADIAFKKLKKSNLKNIINSYDLNDAIKNAVNIAKK